ncbi:MAG: hypothetical protein JWN30_2784 [Bacilli bacterium]|nr:hypothetical protein [Bacilli bacterium]
MNLHDWLAMFLIGVASNLDNAGVGIAYGVRKITISAYSNFIIAVISFIATVLSGYFGQAISRLINPHWASLLGTAVLIAVGVWVLLQPFFSSRQVRTGEQQTRAEYRLVSILRDPETADFDRSKTISVFEAIILGVALAMNALAGGFDAGVTGMDIWITSLMVGILSYLLLGASAYIGKNFVAEKLGDRATIIAGVLLILVGLHQML